MIGIRFDKIIYISMIDFNLLQLVKVLAISLDWTYLFIVLCRVKVTLIDTVVRVEHLPDSAEKGVALEIKIKR